MGAQVSLLRPGKARPLPTDWTSPWSWVPPRGMSDCGCLFFVPERAAMNTRVILTVILSLTVSALIAPAQVSSHIAPDSTSAPPRSAQYEQVQHRLARGWNTWDAHSVARMFCYPRVLRSTSASSTTPPSTETPTLATRSSAASTKTPKKSPPARTLGTAPIPVPTSSGRGTSGASRVPVKAMTS
jgi:hypothetical protein